MGTSLFGRIHYGVAAPLRDGGAGHGEDTAVQVRTPEFLPQLWPRVAHFVLLHPSGFIWKTTILELTVGLKLGSCSFLETSGDKWTDKASSLPLPARAAVKASGIRTTFQEASFGRKRSVAAKRGLSESHRARDGQVLPAPDGIGH